MEPMRVYYLSTTNPEQGLRYEVWRYNPNTKETLYLWCVTAKTIGQLFEWTLPLNRKLVKKIYGDDVIIRHAKSFAEIR